MKPQLNVFTRTSRQCFLKVFFLMVFAMVSPALCGAQESINGVDSKVLIKNLTNKQYRRVRLRAMSEIAQYSKRPGDHLQAYFDGLQDDDEVVRATAAQSLGTIGQRFPKLATELLPKLNDALKDPKPSVVDYAITGLSKLGSAARASIPQLKSIGSTTQNLETKRLATMALLEITAGSDDELQIALDAVADDPGSFHSDSLKPFWGHFEDDRVTKACLKLFEYFGESEDRLGDQASLVRSVRGSKAIVTQIKEELLEIIRRPIKYADANGKDQPKAGLLAARPLDVKLRIWSVVALAESSPESVQEVLLDLTKKLKSTDPMERLIAVILIGRISNHPKAQDMLASVKKLEADPVRSVGKIARLTALRIETAPEGSDYDTNYEYLGPVNSKAVMPKSDQAIKMLKSKIGEAQDAIGREDYLAIKFDLLMPDVDERAWLQNGHQIFDSQQRDVMIREVAYLFKPFEAADYEIQLKGTRAVVRAVREPDPQQPDRVDGGPRVVELGFVWFDGWYWDGK